VTQPSLMLDPFISGQDLAMAPALAASLQYIPEDISYMMGAATTGDLITRPLPRVAWPGKPMPPREQVIETMWPAEYRHRVANPEFSVLLVLFLDAGIFSVMAGMVMLGLCWR